jgi:hypothetical protein
MRVRWFIAWVAILAVLLGMEVNFGMLMAGSSDSPAGTASIAIAPFVGITLLITASRYGRRSPVSLLTLFGGTLFTTIIFAALASKVMWGYYVGIEWPIVFMVVSLVEFVASLLIRQFEYQRRLLTKGLGQVDDTKEICGEVDRTTPDL